uniref:Peptidase C1A papain C-terminal domain-containing protein n=1 Tax=Piliocolobus tephrosceles TaxID=591936 RepID=A0A8C9GJ31_9PRIM
MDNLKSVEEHNKTKSGVTPIKDQLNCGSCWAFSTVGCVESQYAIRKNQILSISEQQLVDCSQKNKGCNGGHIPFAYDDMIELGGLCSEQEYPYIDDVLELCQIDRCEDKIKITGYVEIPDLRYKEAIQFLGPISVAVAVSDSFISYKEGIYDGSCEYDVNHAVMLVGYGMEVIYNDQTRKHEQHYYYIIKNSWGDKWGENGFMRIKTDESGTDKKCDLSISYLPLVA